MMIQTIETDVLPLDGPAFTSPSEAIDYARKSRNRTPRGEDITKHLGKRILSLDYGDAAFRLDLEDDVTLQFQVVEQAIDLRISRTETAGLKFDTGMNDVIKMRLGGHEFFWKRGDLLRSLQGNKFQGIQFSGTRSCYLYAEQTGILRVSILVNRTDQSPLLFWWPST